MLSMWDTSTLPYILRRQTRTFYLRILVLPLRLSTKGVMGAWWTTRSDMLRCSCANLFLPAAWRQCLCSLCDQTYSQAHGLCTEESYPYTSGSGVVGPVCGPGGPIALFSAVWLSSQSQHNRLWWWWRNIVPPNRGPLIHTHSGSWLSRTSLLSHPLSRALHVVQAVQGGRLQDGGENHRCVYAG